MVETSSNHPQMTPYGARYTEPVGAINQFKAATRDSIRTIGQLTSEHRELPNYLVIGTKRGGTTSLARWLLKHPEVRPLFPARETRKGTYYFDVNYDKGQPWYQSHFPTRKAHKIRCSRAGKNLLLGEASPYYLYHPHAAMRARRLVPEAKIIVLLRNPIERAYSHWVERSRQNVETLEFYEALEKEKERLDGEEETILSEPSYYSFAHQHFSYMDQGRYAKCLPRWQKAFPDEQIKIIRSEDLYDNPQNIYSEILDFLNVSDHQLEDFAAWNKKPKDKLDPKERNLLEQELSEDIGAVEHLLGKNMDWS